MDNAQTGIAILKWVVSPDLSVPEIEGIDEDALFYLIKYHRVLSQVLARLETARPKWCPTRFLTRLRMAQHHIRKEAQERMAAAREITRAMQARGLRPPIFVKGFAAYALTGDPLSLHYSDDLDPFAEDLPAFWDVLHEIGYHGKRKDTHEWAKLYRQQMTLDIHQHFPVAVYPDEIRPMTADEMTASRNPGHWHLSGGPSGLVINEEAIGWSDLVEDAIQGVAEGTEELWFPSPTMLCLIHCVHCFRTAIKRLHYLHPYGGFRLYEMLAIRDLAAMPAFDAGLFQDLVTRFSARESVAFINTLSEGLLGVRLLAGGDTVSELGTGDIFPEHLIYGGWVSLQQIDDWLLLRRVEDFIEQLGATVLPETCRIETSDTPRLITYGQSPLLALRVEIAWDKSNSLLTVEWMFLGVNRIQSDYDVLVHFGYASYVQARIKADGSVGEVKQKTDFLRGDQQQIVEVVEHGGDFTVHMACHVPAFPAVPDAPASRSLPLFLAARSLRPDGLQTDSACYLPLILQNA